MFIIDDQLNISLTRGDTPTISITLTDASGNAYDCSGDQSLTFSVKEKYDEAAVIKIPIILRPIPEFTIGAAYTLTRDPGDYYYDICLITADGTSDTFIANKRFTILPEAHDLV